ncbi:hypothetical protein Tbd_1937 [Thiobacillus denitrificans ATCC 25259]|uniref:ATP-binding protein n=1 Tax=Thiobacillus denitrificans (strain ATCC 25259 / T1) TaxID=292415 RepID=Q3SHJ6_THIDA|nr:hypothetical protein [Thiobacillus denitrificans]AAZ97890.1 hypothetical protein Tbd_1937 [Thiobacillus denitrificans ATCC 25259]
MDIVDMIVHVDETIPREKMHELEDVVRADACVISACSLNENPHLLVVTYDPACTSSGKVLDAVQAQGFHAELLGL